MWLCRNSRHAPCAAVHPRCLDGHPPRYLPRDDPSYSAQPIERYHRPLVSRCAHDARWYLRQWVLGDNDDKKQRRGVHVGVGTPFRHGGWLEGFATRGVVLLIV